MVDLAKFAELVKQRNLAATELKIKDRIIERFLDELLSAEVSIEADRYYTKYRGEVMQSHYIYKGRIVVVSWRPEEIRDTNQTTYFLDAIEPGRPSRLIFDLRYVSLLEVIDRYAKSPGS